jgi:glycosyltransferase involved in cell wall biosynthesis
MDVDILNPLKGMRVIERNLFLYNQLKNLSYVFDIIVVYDLLTLFFLFKLLRSWKIAKNCKVVYEVLDSFPEYYSYKLLKNFPILSTIFQSSIRLIEFLLSKHIADKVIVNSRALYLRIKKYNSNTFWIPYTSPFERLNFYNDPQKPVAFIYLGLFSEEKGAKEILRFARQYPNYPIFVIGDIHYSITHFPKNFFIYHKMSFSQLGELLKKLSEQYFLFGFSLIKAKNKSYAIQEANKDIDYLSLGIPILGNKRPATYEKIKFGAGILLGEVNRYNLESPILKAELSKKAKKLYNSLYANSRIKKLLADVFNEWIKVP